MKNTVKFTYTVIIWILTYYICQPILNYSGSDYSVNRITLVLVLCFSTILSLSIIFDKRTPEQYANDQEKIKKNKELKEKMNTIRKNQEINNNSIPFNNTKFELSSLTTGIEFEYFIANLLKSLGYSNVSVTKSGGDQGVDILAKLNTVNYAFQCKFYSSKVGNDAVQQIASGRIHYNAHVGIVVTNNSFTSSAIELAHSNNIILWDGNYLKKLIAEL